MSMLRRVSTSIYASVDKAVARIENHEAVVEASIKDCQAAAAKAKVRTRRLVRDGENLQQQLENAQSATEKWRERARQVGQKDKETAITCLQRSRDSDALYKHLSQALEQHKGIEASAVENLRKIEQRLAALSRQLNTMRAREASSQASRALQQVDNQQISILEDTFERWETSISQSEYLIDHCVSSDPLAEQFSRQEQRETLLEELEILLSAETEKESDRD